MANEMTRRSFLKGAAAAAVAVSLSGVLTGCGGGGGLAHDEVQVGSFVAKVYNAKGSTIKSTDDSVTCKLDATVKLTYQGSASGIFKYSCAFQGTIGDTPLTASPAATNVSITSFVPSSKENTVGLTLTFPNEETYQRFQNGETVVLTITIDQHMTGTVYLTKVQKEVVVTNTMPVG